MLLVVRKFKGGPVLLLKIFLNEKLFLPIKLPAILERDSQMQIAHLYSSLRRWDPEMRMGRKKPSQHCPEDNSEKTMNNVTPTSHRTGQSDGQYKRLLGKTTVLLHRIENTDRVLTKTIPSTLLLGNDIPPVPTTHQKTPRQPPPTHYNTVDVGTAETQLVCQRRPRTAAPLTDEENVYRCSTGSRSRWSIYLANGRIPSWIHR